MNKIIKICRAKATIVKKLCQFEWGHEVNHAVFSEEEFANNIIQECANFVIQCNRTDVDREDIAKLMLEYFK